MRVWAYTAIPRMAFAAFNHQLKRPKIQMNAETELQHLPCYWRRGMFPPTNFHRPRTLSTFRYVNCPRWQLGTVTRIKWQVAQLRALLCKRAPSALQIKESFVRIHTQYRRNIARALHGESESWSKSAREVWKERWRAGFTARELTSDNQFERAIDRW